MVEANAILSFIAPRITTLHQIIRQQSIDPSKKITIVTPTNKTIYAKNIFQNYHRQLYPNKELIIILNNNQLRLHDWVEQSKMYPHSCVFQLDESVPLGECINFAIDHSSSYFVAKFDDDDYYGPNYLTDQIRCFQTTDASIVGKVGHFIYFEGLDSLFYFQSNDIYKFTDYLTGGTHVIKREVFEKVRFMPYNIGEDTNFNHECNINHFKLYATDPFNYLRYRKSNKEFHTWKVDDAEYTKLCTQIADIDDHQAFVTV